MELGRTARIHTAPDSAYTPDPGHTRDPEHMDQPVSKSAVICLL